MEKSRPEFVVAYQGWRFRIFSFAPLYSRQNEFRGYPVIVYEEPPDEGQLRPIWFFQAFDEAVTWIIDHRFEALGLKLEKPEKEELVRGQIGDWAVKEEGGLK